MKHFISYLDYESKELYSLLDRADFYEQAFKNNNVPQILKNKNTLIWSYGRGFRNHLAFDIAAKSMGSMVSFMPGELGVNEPLEDVGQYLQNWYDIIVLRAKNNSDLLQLANNINIPLINSRTDYNHPCEILGDLQYLRKIRGSFEGMKLAFVGEVTNICMSWFEAALKFPIEVIQIAPDAYLAANDVVNRMNESAVGRIITSNDINSIDKTIDVVYTDCWPKNKNAKELFLPYQIKSEILDKTNHSSIFLPCPPVTRGEEVSAEAMSSYKCKNFDAKEYLLYSQMAVLEFIVLQS